MEHAHQNIGCASRIGERAQDVEDGAHTQLFAHRRHVFHGGVVVGREHETNAHLRNALCDLRGREVDADTQTLEHIGAAAFAADAAAAMLADFGTCCGGHKHRTSRNVEGVRAIATGAHDVHQMLRSATSTLVENSRMTCAAAVISPMVSFFTRKRGNESRHQHGRHFARHDEAHDVQHFVVKNFAVFDDALQRFLRGDGLNGVGHHSSLKKVFQHGMAMLGEDGLRVELHPLNVEFGVAHTHDFTIIGPGGHFQARWATVALNRQ